MINRIPPMTKAETAAFYNYGKVPERFQTPEQKRRDQILDYFIRESTPLQDMIDNTLREGGFIDEK